LGDGLAFGARHVDPHRETDAVFLDERPEGGFGHCIMVFEHGVQAQHLQPIGREGLVDGLGLWNAVRHTARAQHLKCVDDDDFAVQLLERGRFGVVGPVDPGPYRPMR